MHCADCGLTHYHDSDIKKALSEIAPTESDKWQNSSFGEITKGYVIQAYGPHEAWNDTNYLITSVEASVAEDLELLRASPLIKTNTQLVGLVYDIETGLLSQVGEDGSDSPHRI